MIVSSSLKRVFLLHKEMSVSMLEEGEKNELVTKSIVIESWSTINKGAKFECFCIPDTLILATTSGLVRLDFPDNSPKSLFRNLNVISIAKLNYF